MLALTHHPLGHKLQDARGLVWLVRCYVSPMKLRFLIRYIRRTSDPSCGPSGLALGPASCLALGLSSSPCALPLSHRPRGTLPVFLVRAICPGVLLSPAFLPRRAVVTLRTSQRQCPTHGGTFGSALTSPCLIRLGEPAKVTEAG